MEVKLILGYWAIRGRGQIPRLLLSYTGQQFEEVQYKGPQNWFGQTKANIGLTFPNLPYLKDGDFNLTEVDAICRYIIQRSKKPELVGKTLKDKAIVNMIYGVIQDIAKETVVLFYDKDHATKMDSAWDKAKPKLQYLADFLKERETCLEYLTYADFAIAQFLGHYIPILYPQKSKQFGYIQKVTNYVQNIPEVKKYYERQNAIALPHLAWFSVIKY